ncbi:MAG: hypothetical protein GY775_02385 [Candidatus Scalindua sp.]|nr:hypothetical protein [Candidatus Scalindua sp.]
MGDPLSHPNVFEWISDIHNKSCDVGIVINPESLNEGISQKLIESRPNSITVSFPGIQRDVFEKLCQMTPFEDALPFPVCRQCDEPLRRCAPPQSPPPENRKERIEFFRSINRNNLS